MKIVNREAFLALPAGTIYSEYEPSFFTGLFVKTSSPGYFTDDYGEQELIGNVKADSSEERFGILDEAEANGVPFALDFHSGSRNGMYEGKQLYAVYEKADIEGLISVLQDCLPFAE